MDFDLVIVGMGPVGASAANLAGKFGLKTLVVDKLLDVYDIPRAIGMDHEVMRLFANFGIADDIADHVMPYRTSEYHTTGSRVIKRIAPASQPYRLGWAPNYVFTQPAIERSLRKNADAFPNVTVELGTEVLSIDQGDGMSKVRLRDHTGSERAITARFLLACDGGTSPIRMGLGLEMEDLQFDEPWMVVDVMVSPDAVDRLPATNVQYCETARPCTYVVGPGLHRRWEITVNPGETAVDIQTPESIRKLLARWLAPHEYTIWRASCYRFHALVLKTWRLGNLFFLGDAAHMTPPFMAQGMCQGIRDASNLIWKLALVNKGLASEDILATYQEERLPHVRETTMVTKGLGLVICERDPVKAAARDEQMMGEMAKTTGPTIRQSLIPPLKHGLLASCGVPGIRGTIFPQPMVRTPDGKEGLLDAFTGLQFRLVVAPGVEPGTLKGDIDAWSRQTGIEMWMVRLVDDRETALVPNQDFRELENILGDWFKENDCQVALVRPDHYVYGGAASVFEAMHLIEELQGKLGTPSTTNHPG